MAVKTKKHRSSISKRKQSLKAHKKLSRISKSPKGCKHKPKSKISKIEPKNLKGELSADIIGHGPGASVPETRTYDTSGILFIIIFKFVFQFLLNFKFF